MTDVVTTDRRPRVAISICTYRRPAVLRELLARLVAVARDAAELATVVCVVVDDDPDASASSVVDEYRSSFEGGVEYRKTGSGNISIARNTALRLGCESGEFVAITDDDCAPHGDWLRELLLAQKRFDADIISGYCIDRPPSDAPGWYVDEPWVRPAPPLPDGTRMVGGALKNTLIRSTAVLEHDLRFDEAFGRAGGEDALFFYVAARRGIDHRYAAAAIVEETVPLNRTGLRYQLRRAVWYGNSEATTALAVGWQSRARIAASSIKRMLSGPAHVLGQMRAGRSAEWRWGLALSLMGVGRFVGALGVRVHHSSMNASAARRSVSDRVRSPASRSRRR